MKNITIISIGIVLLLGSSCKKITEGINVDPNKPTDVGTRYDLLINGAELSATLLNEGSLARLGGMYSRTFTGSDRQYTSLYNYEITAGEFDDNWDRLYGIVIANSAVTITKATALNDKTSTGIAQVIQAMAFGLAADLWGDVPFKEAGDPDKFPTPHFDAQASVYAGVQTLLSNAIANLSANVGAGPGAKDFFYRGSRTKWLAAAYTLKARFYLHTKEYDNAVTNAMLGISSATNNMVAPHGPSYLSSFNVYYSFLTYDRSAYMNASISYAADLLNPSKPTYRGNIKTDEGDRFNYLFREGLNTSDLDPNVLVDFDWNVPTSWNGFFGATTSFPLVSFEENKLILAEAYIKSATQDPINALSALNSVRGYFNAGGGSTTSGSTVSTSTYYTSFGKVYLPYLIADFLPGGIKNALTSGQTQNQALLKEILTERYVTFIGQIEQFNDVRRTKNYLGIPAVKGTKLPQRFLYAQSEINTNPNTPAVSSTDLFKETPVNTTPY